MFVTLGLQSGRVVLDRTIHGLACPGSTENNGFHLGLPLSLPDLCCVVPSGSLQRLETFLCLTNQNVS